MLQGGKASKSSIYGVGVQERQGYERKREMQIRMGSSSSIAFASMQSMWQL